MTGFKLPNPDFHSFIPASKTQQTKRHVSNGETVSKVGGQGLMMLGVPDRYSGDGSFVPKDRRHDMIQDAGHL